MVGLRLRFSASYPLGELLVTQDVLVFSLGLGLSRLVRPWLLDRADVQFFNSSGRTVWLTDGHGSDWRFWSLEGAELVAQLEPHGYRRADVWKERLTPRQLGRGVRGCVRWVRRPRHASRSTHHCTPHPQQMRTFGVG